jgi:hypothetical protein
VISRLQVFLLVVVSLAACRRDGSTTRPDDDHAAGGSPPAAGEPAPAEAHPTVDLDLSPSGIAATIRGPEGAKASARDGHVAVDAEPDFHMEVYKGPFDPLAEKAEVVKEWGPSFRRFVQDDGKTVVYETEVAGDNRFHFFSAGEVDGLLYYCKSEKRGAESIESVQRMIVGCHAIKATDDVTPS